MTTADTSRSPELIEVLRKAVDLAVDDLFVALPGRVEKYSASKQSVDVKPLLKRAVVHEDGTESLDVIPTLPDVPVVFPRAGGYFLSLPVEVGDNVLLIFMDRSIDSFMVSNGQTDLDPVDLRAHDVSDAVALVGFYPDTRLIRDAIGRGAAFGKESGPQLRVNDSAIEATSSGSEKSTGGFVAMATKVNALWLALTAALDAFIPPGSPDGGAALALALSTALKAVPSYQATASSNLKAD